jgi:hypothetical protein
MQTRAALVGDDEASSCKAAEDVAKAAAQAAAKALEKATQLFTEAKATDEHKLQSLQVLATKASKALRNRESVAAAIGTRLEDTNAALQKATAKHEVLGAAHQAVDEELESFKHQVESLAEPLTKCAVQLEEARKAVEAARRKGEEHAALHHAVEADTLVLKQLQTEEASLMQALGEAKTAAAEARERAAMPKDESAGEDAIAKLNILVESAASRCKEIQTQATEAADIYKLAIAKAQEARNEMDDHELDESSDDQNKSPDNKAFAQRRARLERRLKKREEEVEEAKTLSEDAARDLAKALPLAKQELSALQAQLKSAPIPFRNIENLLREELAVVNAEFKLHANKENELLAEATQKMADWKELKITLTADLHRAELEYSVAELNVKATKDLAMTLLAA